MICGSRCLPHVPPRVLLRKCAGEIGQAEPCEPIFYFLHRRPRPAEFGLVDPLDERFYPIDRLARNRPKRTSEGRSLRTQRLLAEIARSGCPEEQTRTRRAPPTRSACSSSDTSTAPADFRPNDQLRRNATALPPHVTMSHTPLHRHSSVGK